MPLHFPGDERAYIENWLKWLKYYRNVGAPPPTSGPTTVIYTDPTMAEVNFPFPPPPPPDHPHPWQHPHGIAYADLASALRACGLEDAGSNPPPPGSHGRGGDDWSDARSLVLSGVALNLVAAAADQSALATAATAAVADWEDAYCGTPPRPISTLSLAVSLAAFANSLQAGALQTAILAEASGLAQKAFAPIAAPASAGS
jgi:hypothetical protein